MTYNEFINNLKKGLGSIYIIYGDEQYYIDKAIKSIKKSFGELVLGINYVIIDDTNLSKLISNIEIPAFGYEKKLIIVKNSGLFKKDGRKISLSPLQEEILSYILENRELIEESCVIVFTEDDFYKNDIYKQISKFSDVVEINELGIKELINEIKRIAKLYKVDISSQNAEYMVMSCGTNLQVIINELRKVIEYAGAGGTIEKIDIDELCIKEISSVIFDLTDNLAIKKIDKSIEILDNLIYKKEPMQKIFITLYNHFRKLYLCEIAIKNKVNIAQALELKPNQTFLEGKYKNQLKYFNEKTLRKMLDEFVNLDFNYKNGRIDLDIGLRSILCTYCS